MTVLADKIQNTPPFCNILFLPINYQGYAPYHQQQLRDGGGFQPAHLLLPQRVRYVGPPAPERRVPGNGVHPSPTPRILPHLQGMCTGSDISYLVFTYWYIACVTIEVPHAACKEEFGRNSRSTILEYRLQLVWCLLCFHKTAVVLRLYALGYFN